jgi:hypothetical protein
MRNNNVIVLLLFLLSLLSIFVRAESAELTQEFWEYMDAIDDGSDSFIDPLDYDQFLAINSLAMKADDDRERQPDKPILRHADMIIDKKSSVDASSSVMTGTTL